MDMHSDRILTMLFSPGPLHPGFKVFSLVEFIAPPCAAPRFALTQKVIRITLFFYHQGDNHEDQIAVSARRPGSTHGPGYGSGPGCSRHAAGGVQY